jgi:hypothetical protein
VWRDLWVGVYVSPERIYICLVPCLPIIIDRRLAALKEGEE